MSATNSSYENGKILGHVFYELFNQNNAVNFKTASQIFLRAIGNLNDVNGNKGVSFDEFKTAMLEVAETSVLLQKAIQNAFADVKIGSQSNVELSSPPSSVNGYITTACDTENMISKHTVTWPNVSGANYYNVWYSPDNFNYIYSFSTTALSAPTYNRLNVDVKVSTCNDSTCGIQSEDSYFQQYFCSGLQ